MRRRGDPVRDQPDPDAYMTGGATGRCRTRGPSRCVQGSRPGSARPRAWLLRQGFAPTSLTGQSRLVPRRPTHPVPRERREGERVQRGSSSSNSSLPLPGAGANSNVCSIMPAPSSSCKCSNKNHATAFVVVAQGATYRSAVSPAESVSDASFAILLPWLACRTLAHIGALCGLRVEPALRERASCNKTPRHPEPRGGGHDGRRLPPFIPGGSGCDQGHLEGSRHPARRH